MVGAGKGIRVPRRILLVSRHDYRTNWRANFHPIADGFAAQGDEVAFVSIGFSPLSRAGKDNRRPLAGRANRWERVDGVDCYLWNTPFHPIGLGRPRLDRLARPLYDLFARLPGRALDEAAAAADLILVESGLSPVLLPRLRRHGRRASIVYVASDLFGTIGAPVIMEDILAAGADAIDTVVVVARAMAPHFRHLGRPIRFVPHGIDPAVFASGGPSPYGPGRHVVTVGSMLFDPGVFTAAATAFPDVTFHLIGTPEGPSYPGNVHEHGPMPFAKTIPWLRHADAGVAPYRPGESADYLSDSSMKLMQYDYLGLPAICPGFAVGTSPLRFGYQPGDNASVAAAVGRALDPTVPRRPVPTLTWVDVAERLAAPDRFADTRIE